MNPIPKISSTIDPGAILSQNMGHVGGHFFVVTRRSSTTVWFRELDIVSKAAANDPQVGGYMPGSAIVGPERHKRITRYQGAEMLKIGRDSFGITLWDGKPIAFYPD